MASIIINDDSFEKEVLKSENLTLVDFGRSGVALVDDRTCVEEISEEMKDDVRITKLNIDENPATPQKYNVRGIPTTSFKNGEVVAEKVGALPKAQLQEWISSNVNRNSLIFLKTHQQDIKIRKYKHSIYFERQFQ